MRHILIYDMIKNVISYKKRSHEVFSWLFCVWADTEMYLLYFFKNQKGWNKNEAEKCEWILCNSSQSSSINLRQTCPFGSCTEEFANKKMLEIANKNNFPDDVLELIKANPIKFHKYQKFDNGRGIGRYYANLIRQMKWGFTVKNGDDFYE